MVIAYSCQVMLAYSGEKARRDGGKEEERVKMWWQHRHMTLSGLVGDEGWIDAGLRPGLITLPLLVPSSTTSR
jgi:hypothetical protein